MRVIVTGGAGFLGRLLIQGLQEQGVEDIVAVDVVEAEIPGCRMVQLSLIHI